MDPRKLTEAQREQLRRPSNVETVIRAKSGAYVVYLFGQGRIAKGYRGKAIRPAFHYRYSSPVTRQENVARWIQGIEAELRAKAQRPKSSHTLKLGDVLRSSWGYEQTNVNYYEVTALIGSTMVEIREIACASIETEWAQGECSPVPGRYVGAPMRKGARDNGVRIASYAWASRIEPIATAGAAKVFAADRWTAYH